MSSHLKESVAAFSEKFGFLLGSGVPLVPSLETILAEVVDPRLEEVVRQVLGRIGEGTGFAEALAAFPDVFSPSYLGMVRAAENQGILDTMMGKIAAGVREGIIPVGGPALAAGDPTTAEARAAVDRLFDLAVAREATDLHLVPTPAGLTASCRAAGRLVDLESFSAALREPITVRVKFLAHLDLAEKWLPQDGRAQLTVAGKAIDARVNVLPVALGEKITISLLSRDPFRLTLDRLFTDPADRAAFLDLISAPAGLVIIAGPHGSGKTTTAYAALQTLHEQGKAVTSIESPVGMIVEGVAQAPVRPHLGLDWNQLLNAFDRSDPDVLFVGEIPDAETLGRLLKIALGGRLVIASMHADDVSDVFRRLLDLQAPPHLLASAMAGVMVQRLVRKVCPDCATDARVKKTDLAALGWRGDKPRAREGKGCDRCNRSGYRGRVALYDVFRPGKTFKDILAQGHSTRLDAALAAPAAPGRRTMAAAGATLVATGQTTLAELTRVLGSPDQD
ncbi:MAG: Flp pilus assembly complex ATPase component TadA [Candidatus Riflebacteria bacterium]|nr:Flp pilus assembly complex ATPase component TadA [Candidatus Riflebacteria bacterium]